tara:strand:- start:16 stop:333 length:318 start_codon:yes stop_codon:yes gene_type:complete
MPFHDSTFLDAAFDTTYGAAYSATITPLAGGTPYTAPGIAKYNVEIFDEDQGIRDRKKTVEFRKADLADAAAGLLRNDSVLINSKTYKIKELDEESEYTLTYEMR